MLFSADHSESLLYVYFHEFYSEVVRIKQQIRNGGVPAQSNQAEPEAPDNTTDEPVLVQVTPAYIQQHLFPILERQRSDAAQRGGEYGATLYREAQYLMAGLADEIFLHVVAWEGRDIWSHHLLESRLFDSSISGEKVFLHLDKLLQERNPVYTDLARIYLITLSLGFQGKYRNQIDHGQLEDYRRQLFSFITQRDTEGLHEHLMFNPDKHLFPDSYGFTVRETHIKPLPTLRKWYWLLAVVILGLLLGSYFYWEYSTADLQQLMDQVIEDRAL